MPDRNIRIRENTYRTLRRLAEAEEITMQALLDKIVEEYWRRTFLEEANRAYLVLRSNPAAWQEEQEERAAWDIALHNVCDDE